jgi:hypothetical protein
MSLLDKPVRVLGVGSKDVTAAATAEQLTTAAIAVSWVILTARPANTGKIAYGNASVVATADAEVGAVLGAGDSVTLPVSELSLVWIDASASGDGVSYTYGQV